MTVGALFFSSLTFSAVVSLHSKLTPCSFFLCFVVFSFLLKTLFIKQRQLPFIRLIVHLRLRKNAHVLYKWSEAKSEPRSITADSASTEKCEFTLGASFLSELAYAFFAVRRHSPFVEPFVSAENSAVNYGPLGSFFIFGKKRTFECAVADLRCSRKECKLLSLANAGDH